MTTTSIDPKLAEQKAELAIGYLAGGLTASLIYLGDKLGLYRAMDGAGAMTSAELAERTGFAERFVREWLNQQAAAGILEYRGAGQFELTPEASLVFVDEANENSVIGMFGDFPALVSQYDRLPEVFRSGIGFTYDDGGPSIARTIDRGLGPWNRSGLIEQALPKVDGLLAKLEAGAEVADVGCGAAAGIIELAKRYPQSRFHGYDNSQNALRIARENIGAAGLTNVFLHNSDEEPLPATPRFDVVLTLDCLHDMSRPDLAAAAIRRAIKPEGTWFIMDSRCGATLEENLENPLGGFLYGISLGLCLPSSASTENGLALGTAGLPEPRMRELVEGAGFASFRAVPLEHPMNAFYEAHP